MADDIDAIFAQIGFGNWQLIAITAAILGPAALAPALIGSTLTNAQVPYRCREAGTLNITEGFDNGCSRSSELVRDVQTAYNTTQWTPTIQETFNNVSNTSCSSWEYDTSVFTSTITMEWGFICENAWLSSLYQMVISAGCMMGDVVGGAVGDRLGRRATLRYGSLVVVAAVLGIGLLPIYSLVLVCRLVLGLTLSSIIYPTYNLVMETTPTSQRTIVGMILCAPYSVSVMVFAGLGYFLRDWRTLHLTSSIFAFLLLPVSWVVDESPRWLAQKGYLEEAKRVLQKAAAYNGSTLPPPKELDKIMQKLAAADSEQMCPESKNSSLGGLKLIFSNRPMATIVLITPLTWFLMAIVYLGIPLNVNNFGGNPFIYMALTGVMELAPTIVGVVFSKRFSRVPAMSISFFGAGLCCLVVTAVTEEMWWLSWILVMVAMEMISTTYMMSYVWAAELYPTVIRSRGSCSCSLGGHFGFVIAPFITDFLAKRFWWLPNVILGLCAVVAGALVFLLPETKDLNLCETVQDVEERWKASKRKQSHDRYNLEVPSNVRSNDDFSETRGIGGNYKYQEVPLQ